MQYRRREIVEAWRWDEKRSTLDKIGCFMTSCSGHKDRPDECTNLRIEVVSQSMLHPNEYTNVGLGDWIVRKKKGFSVYDDETFHRLFEPVEGDDDGKRNHKDE
jgi:hypothetical protein